MSFKIADAYVEVKTRFDDAEFAREIDRGVERNAGRTRRAGAHHGTIFGRASGRHAAREIEDTLGRESKRRAPSMAQRFFKNFAGPFGAAFVKVVTLGMANTDIGRAFSTSPWIALIGSTIAAGIVTAIAGGIAATLSAALALAFAGGVVGLGVFFLKSDPDVVKAANHLADTFKGVFGRSVGGLRMPFIGSMNIFAKSLEKMEPVFNRIFLTIGPALMPLAEGLSGFLEALGPGLEALAQVGASVMEDLGKNLPKWGKSLGDFFIKIRDNWPEIKKSLDEFFSDVGKVIGILASVFIWLARHYAELRDTMLGAVYLVIQIKNAIKLAWTVIKEWVGRKLDEIRDKFRTIKNAIVTTARGLKTSLIAAWREMIQWIKDKWSAFTTWIGDKTSTVKRKFGEMKTGVVDAVTSMRDRVRDMFDRMVKAIADKIGVMIEKVRDAKYKIKGVFSGSIGWLYNVGQNILTGLIRGIGSMIGFLRDKLREVADLVSGIIAQKLRLGSPSRLMRDYGRWTVQGYTQGVDYEQGRLKRTMSNAAETAAARFIPTQRSAGTTTNNNSNVNVDLKVYATPGADGKRIGREAAAEIRKALDEYDRSVKR